MSVCSRNAPGWLIERDCRDSQEETAEEEQDDMTVSEENINMMIVI